MNNLIQYSRTSCFQNLKGVLNKARILSTQTISPELPVEYEHVDLSTRVIKKRPQKPPFMKNMFLGVLDTDILGFPEVLEKEELKELDEHVSVISNYFSELDPKSIEQARKLPENVRNQLQHLKLFGLQSPRITNGLDLNVTENCRILEVISSNSSIATSLIFHQYLGVNAITSKGSEKLVKKYLPKLSKGESIAAFCLLEENNPDPMLMQTNAILSEDGKNWILNGNKSWVVNGSQGDVFIVLASTHDDNSADAQDRMSVFVVEKSFGGVKSFPCQSLGFKGADICNVTFENTVVPVENILGEGADSMQIVTPLLTGLRLSTGPACTAILQKLLRKFSEYTLNTKHGQKYLSDTDFVRDKIAQINLDLYAVESMTYVTAGLMDKFEKQDCDLEAAIIKVFSSEKCLESVLQCIKLLGPAVFMENHWLNSLHNDAMGHVIANETNESLRMVISLLGLQHAGQGLQDAVKKLRNPFFFPGQMIRKMFEQRRQAQDNPKLELGLEGFLHPSLAHSARWLEYCVLRLQYATESMLIRNGPEVVDQHMELKRLADVAMDVYAMSCVLTRASRSYCIGLLNADYELLLANSFCLNARDRVKNNVNEIVRGPYGTNDVNYQKIAKRAFKFNGCFAEHTLTKNF